MTAEAKATIAVEVVYGTPERQTLVRLNVDSPCTAYVAVQQSGICDIWPQINPDEAKMGIFSRALDGKQLPEPKAYVLQEGERVEIYRPLLLDPKEARAKRASVKAAGKADS